VKPSILTAILASIFSLFGAHQSISYPVPATPHTAIVAAAVLATTNPASSTIAVAHPTTTSPSATVTKQTAKTGSPALATATPASAFVTQDQFNSGLALLNSSLRELIARDESAPGSLPASGGFTNSIALSNKIDQLSGVDISGGTIANASVSGITGLSTSDIGGFAYATTSELSAPTNIAAWGDSLTDGSGQTPFTTYLTQLYQGNRYVYNYGVGGDTSGQIEQRMLNYSPSKNFITVIWAGRNDIGVNSNSTIENNIAAMVANLGSNNKYVILSVLNASTEPSGSGNYSTIVQLNSDLAALYPGHYLDIRTYLVQNGLTAAGIAPSSQDLIDESNDVPPTDLRINTLHLTSAAYSVVAQQIYNFFTSTLGITTSTPSSDVLTQAHIQSLFSSPWSIGLVTPNAASFTDLNANNYKTAGVTVLYASSTNASTYVGIGAGTELYATSTPNYNTAVGYQALGNTFQTGASNVAVGYQTLFLNASGTQDVAIGNAALQSNTSGSQNAAVGYFALLSNTTGQQNNAFGYQALYANTTGTNNTAMGGSALRNNITGTANTAFGYLALENNKSATTSVAVGYRAGYGTTSFYSNQGSALLGYAAGQFFQTGSDYNTLLGYMSGNGITTGADNVLIGSSVNSTSYNQVTTGSQNIAIGYNVALASSTLSGQLNIQNIIYGSGNTGTNSTLSTGAIGIGATTTPWARLSIAGSPGGTIPLFAIASSTSGFATSTAFIVDKNGNVGIGTSSPSTALQVNGNITPNVDNIFTSGNATYRWNAIYSSNGTIQTSDARLKTNVATTTYGLDQIMQLRPVSFTWIAQPQQGTQLGFIAQEVQPILPEIVNIGDDPNHTLGLTYTEFIPVVVKSIQQIALISGTFEANLVAWLGNASNGVDDLFAKNLYAQNQLCIDRSDGAPVCITGDQLAAVLAYANQSTGGSSLASSNANPTSTPPVITINGNNPAIVQVGDTYSDLGATITGPQADLNLGITTFLNGALTSNIVIDTSAVATDTIDYVATDQNGLTATSTRTIIIEAATPSPSGQ
jgi:Chaperone of endosialidase/Domain of unknown function (DUF5011)